MEHTHAGARIGSGILVPALEAHVIAVASATLLDDALRGPARMHHRLDRFEERAAVERYLDDLGVASQ
ncbi:MAG TPA: hypothetical protein VMT47_16855 [Polyangia bacterium]|nr:hypothetical protein [Polyangia bacterium]